MKNTAIRNLRSYSKCADFYLLPVRVSAGTKFIALTGEELVAAAKAAPEYFIHDEDELMWKGLQATSLKRGVGLSAFKRDVRKDVLLLMKKADFERGSDGTISEAMENSLAELLTAQCYLGQVWKAVGHKVGGRGYHADLVGDLGTTIEVKGWRGELKRKHKLTGINTEA